MGFILLGYDFPDRERGQREESQLLLKAAQCGFVTQPLAQGRKEDPQCGREEGAAAWGGAQGCS